MAWAQNADRSWTHTGTNRDVLIAADALGQLGAVWLRVADKSSNAKAILCSSAGGFTCVEAGVEGANVIVRTVTLGTAGLTLASGAHGLAASTPFTMRVDLENDVVKVFINGVTPAVVTYDLSTDPTANAMLSQSGYGFTSSVNNAVILQAFKAPLVPNVLPATKILVWAVNGDLWYAIRDPVTGVPRAAMAKARALSATQQISATETQQKLLMCDGVGQHIVFNAPNLTVTDWTRNGITDPFYLVQAFQERVFGVTTVDKQNVWGSAVGDYTDFDTGSQEPGAAYALTLSKLPRIGEPIRAMFAGTGTNLIFACARSFWELTGDPALGGAQINPIVLGIGGSGMNAMAMTPLGAVAAHTTDGLAVIAAGQLARISAGGLTDIIQVDAPLDNFLISVVRDGSLHGCLIFLTPIATGPAVHIWYDERTGGYSPSNGPDGFAGGFWPEDYPDNIGPTCACDWDGLIVLGGRDGYLRVFDTTQHNHDGVVINWRLPMVLAVAGDLDHDVIIQQCTVVRGEDSGEFNVVFYGGRTAEEALAGDDRTLLIRKATTGRETVFMPSVRAPAVVIEMSGLTYNIQGILEAVQVVTTPGEVSLFARKPAVETAFGRSSRRGSTQRFGGTRGPGGGGGGGPRPVPGGPGSTPPQAAPRPTPLGPGNTPQQSPYPSPSTPNSTPANVPQESVMAPPLIPPTAGP